MIPISTASWMISKPRHVLEQMYGAVLKAWEEVSFHKSFHKFLHLPCWPRWAIRSEKCPSWPRKIARWHIEFLHCSFSISNNHVGQSTKPEVPKPDPEGNAGQSSDPPRPRYILTQNQHQKRKGSRRIGYYGRPKCEVGTMFASRYGIDLIVDTSHTTYFQERVLCGRCSLPSYGRNILYNAEVKGRAGLWSVFYCAQWRLWGWRRYGGHCVRSNPTMHA